MTNPFTIDAASMQTIVAKAIMEGVSQEQRDVIMQQAIESLIKVPRDTYGRAGESPLQEAFNDAVRRSCRTVVEEIVTTRTEFIDKLRAAVTDAVDKIIDNDLELNSAVGEAVGTAVTKWASDQRRGY